MSFSSQIKEKLCKSEYGCMNCAAYELSGALMFGGNIGSDSIKFATENENIAKRITADINTAYGIQVVIRKIDTKKGAWKSRDGHFLSLYASKS